MEWRLEERVNDRYPWRISVHSIPPMYDEVMIKSFLKFLRKEYTDRDFRVLKVLNW